MRYSGQFPCFLMWGGVAVIALAGVLSCQAGGPAAAPSPASQTASQAALMSVVPQPTARVSPSTASVAGIVVDSAGAPVFGATVRVQATTNQTLSDEEGRFILSGMKPSRQVTISAWKDTYYCDKVERVVPPAVGVRLVLRAVQTNDNASYEWIPPTGSNSCYSCKPAVTQVWLDNDAHGKSATNIRFLTMYNGTDVHGDQSPLTRHGYSRDYGAIPLRPDPTKPYYGPGYKLDFPDNAGNCAACHIPGAAVDAPYGTDPNTIRGVNKFGVHCDYCHKVAGVTLDATTGLPFPNMPGVLSQDIRRPFPDDKQRSQIFFGSFDDTNVPAAETYLPLIQESQWCAPCHFGVFWDTVVYNSFGEWLASPYSDPKSGKACQQCHMPAPTDSDGQALSNIAPGKGGVDRDPLSFHAHTFPGGSSPELLQNAVTMKASARRQNHQLAVEVNIVNDKTGHDVPTDSPLRQMILLVQASDFHGKVLPQVAGSTVPEWGGVGDPADGNYAGLPGKGFAKILSELWTEISPTGAYWNPTRVVSDNRLAALESDTGEYRFTFPSGEGATVQVTLLHRRAFKLLMDQKGWAIPDIVMAKQVIAVP